MQHEELTIASIEKEIEELEKEYADKAEAKGIDPLEILGKVCAIVTIAMPALKLIKRVFFFSKKIQSVIQRIIDIADMVCGEEEIV